MDDLFSRLHLRKAAEKRFLIFIFIFSYGLLNNSSMHKWGCLSQKQQDTRFVNKFQAGMNCPMFDTKANPNHFCPKKEVVSERETTSFLRATFCFRTDSDESIKGFVIEHQGDVRPATRFQGCGVSPEFFFLAPKSTIMRAFLYSR